MAVELAAETPLALAVQREAQTKLAEWGWISSGLDDSALSEYIILMVVNGKTADEVASELSTDLLDDPGAIAKAPEFTRWLFQRIEELDRQMNGANGATMQDGTSMQAGIPSQPQGVLQDSGGGMMVGGRSEDADMDDSQMDGAVPTGPKNMRAGVSRDRRMLGQMNKALNRSEPTLHRIKGAAGVGRINSHNREPPKGPAGVTPRGPRATMTRLANSPIPPRQMQQMQQMNQMSANNPNNPFTNMTQQQQMQLFAMYEQQAKMMSQIFGPAQQQQVMSGQGGPPFNQQEGKSLFDRIDSRGSRQNGHFNSNGSVDTSANDPLALDSSMEVEPSSQGARPDSASTMCRFNLSCTNPSCYFVHQSPAAPPGTTIDMTDTCSFGASCKNRKCTGKHPSPSKLGHVQAATECKYYPACTNPACPFTHPTMPPCRNGPNCTNEGCKFFHSKVACKFDPCLNPACPYRHSAGQKRGNYKDKVWVNRNEGEHVSERKFVVGEGEEELVRPEQADENMEKQDGSAANAQEEGIAT